MKSPPIAPENRQIVYQKTVDFAKHIDCNLLDSINNVVSSGFCKSGDPDDVRCHVFDSENIGLVYDDGELVGFATTRNLADLDLCYLHGVAVSKTNNGIGPLLVEKMFLESGMSLFGFTTQNPAMFLAAKKCVCSIFPNEKEQPTDFIMKIGRELVRDRPGKLLNNMVVKNLYECCLYPQIPLPRNEYLWQWWQQMLEIDEFGRSKDGIVFIGYIN